MLPFATWSSKFMKHIGFLQREAPISRHGRSSFFGVVPWLSWLSWHKSQFQGQMTCPQSSNEWVSGRAPHVNSTRCRWPSVPSSDLKCAACTCGHKLGSQWQEHSGLNPAASISWHVWYRWDVLICEMCATIDIFLSLQTDMPLHVCSLTFSFSGRCSHVSSDRHGVYTSDIHTNKHADTYSCINLDRYHDTNSDIVSWQTLDVCHDMPSDINSDMYPNTHRDMNSGIYHHIISYIHRFWDVSRDAMCSELWHVYLDMLSDTSTRRRSRIRRSAGIFWPFKGTVP